MNHKNKYYKRVLTSLLFSLVLLLLPVSNYAEVRSEILAHSIEDTPDTSEPEFWMPPGELISIGSHRLHLFCLGTNQREFGQISPTVVIDSGLGGFSLEWYELQKQLAEQSRVCTYDRAGYGWSDPGPFPRTTKTIVYELKILLKTAGITKSYVLAGHSFGGYNMMYFAKRFPSDVAGLVLIDSSHPEQFSMFPTVYPVLNQSRSKQRLVSVPRLPENYPEEMMSLGFNLMNTRKARQTLRFEGMNFEISASQVTEAGSLPQIPLVILTRGKRVWPDTEQGRKNENNWTRLQNELAGLVEGSRHVMAEFSGHFIHLDQPFLVKEIINGLVDYIHCDQQPDLATYGELNNEVQLMNWGIRAVQAGEKPLKLDQKNTGNEECWPE